MIYFISDTHFGNENIIKYCDRPFLNTSHQTLALIYNWNSVVIDNDDVYMLGDFIMGSDMELVHFLLRQLKGRIHLIRGNHDSTRKLEIYQQYPQKIVEIQYFTYLIYKGKTMVLCHFPIMSAGFAKMCQQKDTLILHGHVHNKAPLYDPASGLINVSADVINFTPISFPQLMEHIRRINAQIYR